jgi:ELWxxDGT repeat protein
VEKSKKQTFKNKLKPNLKMQKKVSLTITFALICLVIYAQTTAQTALNLWQNFNQQNVVGSAQNHNNADRAVNAIHFKPQKEITSDWDSNNSVWYFHDSVRNSYNSSGNITQKLQYNGGSTIDYKNIYVYDGNGKITSDSSFYNPGNGFINNTLYTYTYDGNGNKTQQIYFTNWNGSSWTSGNKTDYTYDVNNNRIQGVDQLWNGTAWNNSSKETNTWSSGLLTTGIFQSWSGTAWTNAWKVDYTNVGGQTNGFTGFSWTGSSWQSASKYTNVTWYQWNGFFNETSKLSGSTEQVPDGSLWKDTIKLNFSYDSFGNQINYLRQIKPNSVYITTEGFKNLYQYNGNNSIIVDTLQQYNPFAQPYENYKKREYSDFYQYTVTSCIPDQPGSISGNTDVNSGDSETYSIAPVAGATSYNWTLPSGWAGTSTSSSITAVTGTTGGTITVSAVNSCGSSLPEALVVLVDLNVQTSNCAPELFKDLRPGYSGSYPINFRELNGTLYFSNYDGLWKTNGTDAGTVEIDPLSSIKEVEVLNNDLIFCAPSPVWQLLKSDGTTTTLIKEFPNATSSDGIFNLTPANGFVFFTVNENYVRKLWRTDGTEAGTILVKDIDPTNNINYIPGGYFEFNNSIYFNAGTTTTGQELWKSDGTEAGTTIVKDIKPGVGSGHTNYGVYAILNNELYFYANDGSQYGLWKTDGSDAGTVFVKECLWIDEISNINNVIYFSAYDIGANTGNTLYGEELWRSDGTPSGTYMVKDINPGQNGSKHNDYQFKAINSAIVFSAKDGINGVELWKTDGTEAGTMLLKNIDPDVINAQIGLSSSKVLNGYLYFSANNGTTGVELWKTDGTETGTALVADLYPGANGSGPFDFTIFNGNVFFRAESASAGVELWSCVAVTSSVADVELADIVSIYPNPSTGVFNIKSKSQLKDASIKVYSIYGQVFFESNQFVSEIDLSNQPAGVYFIQLKSGETFINKRIVIQ